MSKPYAELAATLQSRLGLGAPPVALAFVAEAPADVPRLQMVMPATCAFWRRAESEVFFASAADHAHCPLGAHVMGFTLPEAKLQELMAEVGEMCSLAYVREEEVERVPRITQPSAGIVYGPLSAFPLEPQAVIIWTTPLQAMVLSESCDLVNWAKPDDDSILGRPGCAAIPRALQAGTPAQSFGCVGMRMFTEIPGEQFLMVIPRQALDQLDERLFATVEVHRQMRDYYRGRTARLSPTR